MVTKDRITIADAKHFAHLVGYDIERMQLTVPSGIRPFIVARAVGGMDWHECWEVRNDGTIDRLQFREWYQSHARYFVRNTDDTTGECYD